MDSILDCHFPSPSAPRFARQPGRVWRLTFREQLVGGFVQMPLGALSICQVSNQLSGKLVNVHAYEVIDLLSLEIENGRAKDDRYGGATAVEYFSVHDLPPIESPRQRLRLLGGDSETNRNLGFTRDAETSAGRLFPLRLLCRLLARVFRQYVQDSLHHGPYCFGASQWSVLLGNPAIEGGEMGGL